MFDKDDQPKFFIVLISSFLFTIGISIVALFSDGSDISLSMILKLTAGFTVYFYVLTFLYQLSEGQSDNGLLDKFLTFIVAPLSLPLIGIYAIMLFIENRIEREV
jgi:hypothetical protein